MMKNIFTLHLANDFESIQLKQKRYQRNVSFFDDSFYKEKGILLRMKRMYVF